VKEGSRRRTQWEVEKIEEEPSAAASAAPRQAQSVAPPAPQQATRSANPARKTAAPQPAPELAAQLCEMHREANCSLCTPTNEQQESLSPVRALHAAINAVAVAETHAASRGLAIRFGAEDIRAMALTLLIDANRRAR
jgi:hypothetical protein